MANTVNEFLATGGVLQQLMGDLRITRVSLGIIMPALKIPTSSSAWDKSKKMWYRGESFKILRDIVENELDDRKAYKKAIMITNAFAKAGFVVP